MESTVCSIPETGFNFENCQRNAFFSHKGFPVPKVKKTGTTTAGVVFQDGVVIGADTRATVGSIIADKNCSKIHFLARNIYCCGAGTSADIEQVTRMVASQLELHRLSTDRVVPVKVAERLLTQHLFRYHGLVGAALIVGGFDFRGPHVCSVSPWGCSDFVPFTSMGSGSLAAMSILEKGWKENLTLQEAKQLVRDAIASGIFNDLGSGSSVDLCVITKEGAQHIRPYDIANVKGERHQLYSYAKGTTPVLASKSVKIDVIDTCVKFTGYKKKQSDFVYYAGDIQCDAQTQCLKTRHCADMIRQMDGEMDSEAKKAYVYCIVPGCTSSNVKLPSKRLLTVPRKEKLRKKWCCSKSI